MSSKRCPEQPSRGSILLVDDDRIGTEVRAALLESTGFSVTIANSGLEALGQVKHHCFDAILLDHDMPLMNGIELARCLRGLGYTAPIVMLSGRLESPLVPGSELLNGFVSKGESPAHLIAVLRAITVHRLPHCSPPDSFRNEDRP